MNRNRSSSNFEGIRAAATAASAAGSRRAAVGRPVPIRLAGGLRRQNEGWCWAGPRRAALPPADRSACGEGVSLCLW